MLKPWVEERRRASLLAIDPAKKAGKVIFQKKQSKDGMVSAMAVAATLFGPLIYVYFFIFVFEKKNIRMIIEIYREFLLRGRWKK